MIYKFAPLYTDNGLLRGFSLSPLSNLLAARRSPGKTSARHSQINIYHHHQHTKAVFAKIMKNSSPCARSQRDGGSRVVAKRAGARRAARNHNFDIKNSQCLKGVTGKQAGGCAGRSNKGAIRLLVCAPSERERERERVCVHWGPTVGCAPSARGQQG